MREKKYEPVFIPCGDSMEKMEAINDDILESVSGGASEPDGCSVQLDDYVGSVGAIVVE